MNSTIVGTGQGTWSSFMSEHQVENSCHLFTHGAWVDSALACRIVLWTLCTHSERGWALQRAHPQLKAARVGISDMIPTRDKRSFLLGRPHSKLLRVGHTSIEGPPEVACSP